MTIGVCDLCAHLSMTIGVCDLRAHLSMTKIEGVAGSPQAIRKEEKASFYALSSLNPSLRKIDIAGHQFVSPDWKRFRPTKAVNSNHQGETQ